MGTLLYYAPHFSRESERRRICQKLKAGAFHSFFLDPEQILSDSQSCAGRGNRNRIGLSWGEEKYPASLFSYLFLTLNCQAFHTFLLYFCFYSNPAHHVA